MPTTIHHFDRNRNCHVCIVHEHAKFSVSLLRLLRTEEDDGLGFFFCFFVFSFLFCFQTLSVFEPQARGPEIVKQLTVVMVVDFSSGDVTEEDFCRSTGQRFVLRRQLHAPVNPAVTAIEEGSYRPRPQIFLFFWGVGGGVGGLGDVIHVMYAYI